MAIDKKKVPEVNAGSMADIAFLLLIFFLVTTTIASDKGLTITLPPKREKDQKIQAEVNARDVFNVLVNFKNQLLVEGKRMNVKDLKEAVKKFIDNNGKDPDLSVNPEKAVVSLKTDRGTNYKTYISILDAIKAAYHELRAKHMGITVDEYLAFDAKKANKAMKVKYDNARKAYPLNISEAEPTQIGK